MSPELGGGGVCVWVSYAVIVCVCVSHWDIIWRMRLVEKMSWRAERGGFLCSAQGQEVVAAPRLWQPLPALKSFFVLVLWELW